MQVDVIDAVAKIRGELFQRSTALEVSEIRRLVGRL